MATWGHAIELALPFATHRTPRSLRGRCLSPDQVHTYACRDFHAVDYPFDPIRARQHECVKLHVQRWLRSGHAAQRRIPARNPRLPRRRFSARPTGTSFRSPLLKRTLTRPTTRAVLKCLRNVCGPWHVQEHSRREELSGPIEHFFNFKQVVHFLVPFAFAV